MMHQKHRPLYVNSCCFLTVSEILLFAGDSCTDNIAYQSLNTFNLFHFVERTKKLFAIIIAHIGKSCKATFDFVERIVAFDNVASTLLLLWTGLTGCRGCGGFTLGCISPKIFGAPRQTDWRTDGRTAASLNVPAPWWRWLTGRAGV